MPVIENNREDLQYQLFESGELVGFVQYRMSGHAMWVLHSSLSRSFKSPGLVAALLRHVLEDSHRSRVSVLPFCPAMRTFVRLRPQYADLIPADWRPRLLPPALAGKAEHVKRPLDYVRLAGSRRARLRATVSVGH